MRICQDSLPPCVLVTPGQCWPGILGMVRSIGRRGVRVYAVGLGVDMHVAGASRYCHEAVCLPYDGDRSHLAESLLGWLETADLPTRPILFTLSDDTSVSLAEIRDRLEDRFIVGVARTEVVVGMADKRSAVGLAAANGLTVPQSGFATSLEELRQVARTVEFPVIVKPTTWEDRGKAGFKFKQFDTPDELLAFGAASLTKGPSLIVQQFIPGGDETIEVYMFYRSRDGRTIHGCTGRKIRQHPPGAGIMASGEAVWLPHVAEMSEAFLTAIDYRGLGGIEYKRYGGKSYFIEMSVRPEGFHVMAVDAGVDLPWYAYRDLALDEVPREPVRQTKPVRWLSLYTYMGIPLSGARLAPYVPEIVRLMLSARTKFAIWRWDDLRPGVVSTVDTLKAACRKLVRWLFCRKGR